MAAPTCLSTTASLPRPHLGALKRLPARPAAELDALLPVILDRAFKGQL